MGTKSTHFEAVDYVVRTQMQNQAIKNKLSSSIS